jgi:hypothetical protein
MTCISPMGKEIKEDIYLLYDELTVVIQVGITCITPGVKTAKMYRENFYEKLMEKRGVHDSP